MPDTTKVTGRCPACRGDSLHVMDGGHITCSRLDCPNPTAADDLLAGASTTEWGVERDNKRRTKPPRRLDFGQLGVIEYDYSHEPERVLHPCADAARAHAFADRMNELGLNPRILRRQIGLWEPAPAEDSAGGCHRCNGSGVLPTHDGEDEPCTCRPAETSAEEAESRA